MLDIQVTPEVADAIAEIGRVDPRYHSPEGVLFRKALALIAEEKRWANCARMSGPKLCSLGALHVASKGKGAINGWIKQMNALSVAMGGKAWDSGEGVIKFNDSHSHAEVIQVWRSTGFAHGWL